MQMKMYKSRVLLILFVCLFVLLNVPKTVFAEGAVTSIGIDSPVNSATISDTTNVTGTISGQTNINKVEISVDDKVMGNANYLADSGKFSFSLNTKKLVNGVHKLKVVAYDASNQSYSKEISFTSNNVFTSIVGQTKATKWQMIKYLLNYNSNKDFEYADNFVSILLDEAAAENIKADVAFAQMMKETNFLKFTGTVNESQNNFAGLGCTGPGVQGLSFSDIRTGIRAVIQHLKAYATTTSLNRNLVDPRFQYVQRGSSEFVEWLGIPDNPLGKGWAADAGYGYDIVNRVNYISSINVVNGQAKLSLLNVSGQYKLTVTASATSVNKPLYRFWVADRTTGEWTIVQDYGLSSTLNWTPKKPGKYTIVVHVKDSFSSGTGDYCEDYLAKDVTIQAPKATGTSLTVPELWSNYSSDIVAAGTSPNKVMYRFWIGDRSTGEWKIVQDYSENNVLKWKPTKPGKYAIVVDLKDASNPDMSENASDSYLNKEVEVKNSGAALTQFNVDSKATIYTNKVITASATSKNKVLYRFWVCDRATGEWTIVQDYSENNTLNWKPTKLGRYTIVAHVKDSASTGTGDYCEDSLGRDVVVEPAKATGTSLTVPELWSNYSSDIVAAGTSPNKVMYRFWIGDRSTGEWKIVQDYSENNVLKWKPTKPGKYAIVVDLKDASNPDMSENASDSYLNKEVEVKNSSAVLTQFNVDSRATINTNKVITANATSKNKVLYRFWVCDRATGEWTIVQDYSENNTLNWKPTKLGRYTIVAHVKDSASTGTGDYCEDSLGRDVVVEPAKATGTSLTVPELWANYSSDIVAAGTSPNKVMYRFWIGDRSTGEWKIVQDYSENNVLSWKPTKPGRYAIVAYVKDSSNPDMSESAADSYLNKEVEVKNPNAVITAFNVNANGSINKAMSITTSATSKNKVLYKFWVCDRSTGEWTVVQDYSTSNTLSWTPKKAGKYTVVVYVKDSASTGTGDYCEDYLGRDITVRGTIVLDAGHGGYDSGATGSGYKEKDLNLQVVQKLGKKLEAMGFNVLYTRNTDDFVSLEDRVDFANNSNADLFLSIHHDAADSTSANGASTHYSSFRPDIETNGAYVTLYGKKYPVVKEENSYLYYLDGNITKTIMVGASLSDGTSAIAYDSTPCDAAVKSKAIAEQLVQALGSLDISGSRGIQDHNLYVTRWTTMPSVLAELGFISGSYDINYISSPAYQDKEAQKMADVIYNFFMK